MDDAYAAAYPDLYRRHWWWRVRERILLDKVSRLLAGRDRPARILDVGCGAGLFFDALEQFGHVEGIESDEWAVEHSGKWRPLIHAGILDAGFNPANGYDAILMLDLLEHVDAPDQVLRDGRRLLNPGGRLIITVPAFNWLWTMHDDLNHHVRRYTADQIAKAVAAAGLEVTDSTYLFQSLVLPKILIRIKERTLGGRATVPTIPANTINSALQSFFRTEYVLARWLPFGTSLLVVARLPDSP
jgi:2-polyprenyl-3-methyl-5-hydroxy-6-metoxy-1,4-benzoquinol methylase